MDVCLFISCFILIIHSYTTQTRFVSSLYITSVFPYRILMIPSLHELESTLIQQNFYIKAPTPAAAANTSTNALRPSEVFAPEVDVADEAELLRVAVEVMVAIFPVFVADCNEGLLVTSWRSTRHLYEQHTRLEADVAVAAAPVAEEALGVALSPQASAADFTSSP